MQLRSHTLCSVQRARKFAITACCVIVGAMLFVTRPAYENANYGLWLDAAGVLLIAAGFGIRMWCIMYIGGRKKKQLMSDGPYSLCRNPLYVGSILAACGIGLQTKMLTFGILGGVICWAVFRLVVAQEEKFLLATFGEPYRRYCETTPRFFPRFSAYRDEPDQRIYKPSHLWNTFRDGLYLFAIIPITQAIDVAYSGEMLTALFHLY